MATSCPAGAGGNAPQSPSRTVAPDLRLLHYNDVYHIEYVPVPSAHFVTQSLNLFEGLAQRSLLAALLDSKP